MLLETLLVLYCVLLVAIACVIVIKYRKTRDPGFLWLGAGVLLWPLLTIGIAYGVDVMINRVKAGENVGVYPFSLIETGRATVGYVTMSFRPLSHIIALALILVGVMILYRKKVRD